MDLKRSLAAGGIPTVGLAIGLFFSSSSAGQAPAAPSGAANGRYDMELKAYTQGGNFTTVFVMDTQTGHCWYCDTSSEIKQWTDMGSPIQKAEQ